AEAHRTLAAMEQNRSLGAMNHIDRAAFLEQAAASTRRYQEGRPLSPLDGIPFVVKDQIDVAGMPTTNGSPGRGRVATNDAAVVGRLRAAGALVVGKSAMHELGMGVTGQDAHHRPTLNPVNRAHVAGGSSGGSAAAVASGMVPIAVASDAGGSTRIPAALVG